MDEKGRRAASSPRGPAPSDDGQGGARGHPARVQTGIHVATADGTVTSAAPPSPFAATLPGGKSNGLFYFGLNQTRRMIKFSRVLALFSLFVVLFLFLFLRGIKLTANLLPSFWKEKSYQLVQSIVLVKVRCTVHFQNVYIVHYGCVWLSGYGWPG